MISARLNLAAGTVTALRDPATGSLHAGGVVVAESQARFAPAADGLVCGVILNDRASLEALGGRLEAPPYGAPPRGPVLYLKPRNTLAAHRATVVLPAGAGEVEVGGTLGLVLGESAARVPESEALDRVRGYTVVADLALAQADLYRPPIRERCFDAACPIGPWVVDRALIPDPDALEVRTTIGAAPAYTFRLRELVRPLARLLAEVSAFMTLDPGDVLLAGVPTPAPRARPGDAVAVAIDGVGRLEFTLAGGRAGA